MKKLKDPDKIVRGIEKLSRRFESTSGRGCGTDRIDERDS